MMGDQLEEGDELVLRMFRAGEFPDKDDTHDAVLEVREIPGEVRSEMDYTVQDPILLERSPDSMDHGSNYEFIIRAFGEDYLIDLDDSSHPLDEWY